MRVILFIMICSPLFLSAQSVFYENFNTDANAWQLSTVGGGNAWRWFSDQGTNMSGGLRTKVASAGNYFISPGMSLTAGQDYTIYYMGKKNISTRDRHIYTYVNDSATVSTDMLLLGDAYFEPTTYSQPPFELQTLQFTPDSTDTYYFVNVAEGTGYVFLYVDDYGVEVANPPTIAWTSVLSDTTIIEDTAIQYDVLASDSDGSVDKVEFYIDQQLVYTDYTNPFSFDTIPPLPGIYDVQAIAYDNRNLSDTTDIIEMTVTFPDGSLQEYVHYDMESMTEYWDLYGGWRSFGLGYLGSQSLYGQYLQTGNYASSPPLFLKKDSIYTIEWRQDAKSNNKSMDVSIHTDRGLGGTILASVIVNSSDDFTPVHYATFTPSADDHYHITFSCPENSGYKKLIVDEVRLRGTHNQAPFIPFFELDTPIKRIIEGADFTTPTVPFDVDGAVASMSLYANGVHVATDNISPFEPIWTNAPVGNYEIYYQATDQEGATNISAKDSLEVVANPFSAVSYLGDSGDDEIRGSLFTKNNKIVLAANLSAPPQNVTTTYLAGTTSLDNGYLLLLNETGTIIEKSVVVADKIGDLTKDDLNRIYVAAGTNGIIQIDVTLSNILYQQSLTDRAHRIDVGSTGYAVVLTSPNSNYDDVKLANSTVYLFDPLGSLLNSFSGGIVFTDDVAIDETTQTIVTIGYKNISANTPPPENANFPVDVPQFKGFDFDGTQRYFGYNWNGDNTSNDWLNLAENNMADTRATRCTIGKDGLLYIMYEVDGGNTILRYKPFDNLATTTTIGGDDYSEFFNTSTEPKLIVGRYDPFTGNDILHQRFTARLSNGSGNTIRTKNGAIEVDRNGAVYIVGESASGIPINLEPLPGTYVGGSFVLKLSPDFTTRELVTRFTRGSGKCIGLGSDGAFVMGGMSHSELFDYNAIQTTLNSAEDAWFAVIPSTCIPKNGTYYINQNNADNVSTFATIADAFRFLNECGMDAPVTLEIITGSGPYTELLDLYTVCGNSDINCITIDGNGEQVQVNIPSYADYFLKTNNGISIQFIDIQID